MMELLHTDAVAWVGVSFFVFILAFIKFGGPAIVGALDKRIAQIKDDIESAERLKAEAQALLTDFESKQRDAQVTADRIIAEAKASAKLVQETADAALTESMARRESQLTERLKRIEEKAIADIQNHAADLAIQATKEIVAKTLDDKAGHGLIDEAIRSASKYLN